MSDKNNSWFDQGELPPVGSVVLYSYKDGYSRSCYTKDWNDGDELEILSHKEVCGKLLCVVFNRQKQNAQCLVSDCMLPLRTDREKFIDAAMRAAGDHHKLEDALGNLFDAGFKAPEEK